MTKPVELQKWRKALASHAPIIGAIRRRGAMSRLESALDQSGVVRVVIEALASPDEEIARRAKQALLRLSHRGPINALCAAWAKSRDSELESIILDCGYVASKPLDLRVLTSLKHGRHVTPMSPPVVAKLLVLMKDQDATIASTAESNLHRLESDEDCDALCDVAIREPDGIAAQWCSEKRLHHSDPRQNALLLFVTRRLDEYFEEDFEFQQLRPAYDAADEAVKRHVLAVVRAGDRRCAAFFSTKSRSLQDSTNEEIQSALDSFLRHEDYAELFQACLQLPLKYGVRILEQLAKTGWAPDDPQLASLYKELVRETAETVVSPPREPDAESAVFERWLSEGRALSDQPVPQLLKMLENSPIDGVKTVGALASLRDVPQKAKDAVASSEHWLVRLAGHATGLTIDIMQDRREDSNYWIRELVATEDVLEFSPTRATPEDLKRLNEAPREAFTGRLGGIRRALRCLLTYQVDTLVAKRPKKKAAPDAATFVRRKKK